MPDHRACTAAAALLAAALFFPTLSFGADAKGQYSIRGVGLITCAIFIQERLAQEEVYLVTAAWLDGYITGLNQASDDTYDVLSFEGSELLMQIIERHCRENPNDTVFAVMNSLLRKLHDDRLPELARKLPIEMGENRVQLYTTVIERVQTALAARGLYSGEIDGVYSEPTARAMQRFQETQKLKATGFPDQLTLWRLLRS